MSHGKDEHNRIKTRLTKSSSETEQGRRHWQAMRACSSNEASPMVQNRTETARRRH